MLALVLFLPAALCVARGSLPDPACTPGALETTDLAVVCGTPTRARRRVSGATRARVMASYGVRRERWGEYELDHLVPLAVGGSNDEANLWPEPLGDALLKDRVEDEARRRVCSGRMGIAATQARFATDWRKVLGP